MFLKRKSGFTLVELMVVISIIGVLAAALISPINSARRTGRAIRCKNNLKNLTQGTLTAAVDSSVWQSIKGKAIRYTSIPSAGSYETLHVGVDMGQEETYLVYTIHTGWVTGNYSGRNNLWPNRDEPRLSNNCDELASYYFYGDREAVYQSITNGVAWRAVGGDLGTYICQEHVNVAKKQCRNVMRSYVMNAYFGANVPTSYASDSARLPRDREWHRRLDNLSYRGNAGLLLLFAELPAYNWKGEEDVKRDLGPSDGVLDVFIKGYSYRKPAREETIGFNHRIGKRMVGHVSFVDGHVDAIIAPDRASEQDLRDLTFLLCNGLEVPARKEEWSRTRSDYENNVSADDSEYEG